MTSFHMGGARRLTLVGERGERGTVEERELREKCIDPLRPNATETGSSGGMQNRESGKFQHA